MPALPTITVTQAQADRMLAAYGSVDNYLKWLTDSIIDFVVDREISTLSKAELVAYDAKIQAARAKALTELGRTP